MFFGFEPCGGLTPNPLNPEPSKAYSPRSHSLCVSACVKASGPFPGRIKPLWTWPPPTFSGSSGLTAHRGYP